MSTEVRSLNKINIMIDDGSINAGVGVNQTWKNESANRESGVVYTNTTGRTIQVKIYGTYNNNAQSLEFYIDGLRVDYSQSGNAQNDVIQVSAIVPDGSTYQKIRVGGSAATWHELS